MNKNVLKNIIKNAYTLFKEKGYKETTILDICEACSITKTTFYRYVNSKEDLLAYYFDDIDDDLIQLVVQIAQSNNHVDSLLSVFQIVIDRMQIFGQDLYAQLYISNLSGNNNSFDDNKLLKEVSIALIRKAQDMKQIQNMNDAEELYETCKIVCFGGGILWCLNQIEDVETEILKTIKATLQVVE